MLLVLALATVVAGEPPSGVVKYFQDGAAAMVLGDRRGVCPEGEREAIFVQGGKATPGCWHESDNTVWIWWKDGDVSAVPNRLFTIPRQG